MNLFPLPIHFHLTNDNSWPPEFWRNLSLWPNWPANIPSAGSFCISKRTKPARLSIKPLPQTRTTTRYSLRYRLPRRGFVNWPSRQYSAAMALCAAWWSCSEMCLTPRFQSGQCMVSSTKPWSQPDRPKAQKTSLLLKLAPMTRFSKVENLFSLAVMWLPPTVTSCLWKMPVTAPPGASTCWTFRKKVFNLITRLLMEERDYGPVKLKLGRISPAMVMSFTLCVIWNNCPPTWRTVHGESCPPKTDSKRRCSEPKNKSKKVAPSLKSWPLHVCNRNSGSGGGR